MFALTKSRDDEEGPIWEALPMTDLFLLSQAQMRRIVRYFPLSHGVA